MKRFAILGNHLPRHCGIGTFTTHLADALATALPDADQFLNVNHLDGTTA